MAASMRISRMKGEARLRHHEGCRVCRQEQWETLSKVGLACVCRRPGRRGPWDTLCLFARCDQRIAQEELYLEDDAYFQELLARYKELVPVGAEPTEPRAKQLREQMRIRAGQLAVDTRKLHAAEERAASRMATLYPFVGLAPLGVALWSIPVEADEEFRALLLKREEAWRGSQGPSTKWNLR
ncbi:Flagellar Member 3 [Trypanosoma cruzi]|uniref:Flagellar Member 3 n=1 Tax=Trypanosoma cruzi TaxID=5693 RepID=A0A2V2XIH0_TRYCR|nr:Flagellar Member 3 [Trypanosoma cruzi]